MNNVVRMGMLGVVVIGACAAMVARGRPEPSAPAPRTIVLAELFTSEGCSSCPPADALLRRLVAEQPIDGVEIVGFGSHVDYWDRLGWRDPFSSPVFSERQESYSASRVSLELRYTRRSSSSTARSSRSAATKRRCGGTILGAARERRGRSSGGGSAATGTDAVITIRRIGVDVPAQFDADRHRQMSSSPSRKTASPPTSSGARTRPHAAPQRRRATARK